MSSVALSALQAGLLEVGDLEAANPSPTGGPPRRARVTRAIGRGAVVILYSHFERYVRAINEEAVNALNPSPVVSRQLTERLRLQHSRLAIDGIHLIAWEKRAAALARFVASEAWLWDAAQTGILKAEPLVDWLVSVEPKLLVRFYAMWGIPDVFSAITRRPTTRTDLRLRIDELVNKRHRIAHGDPAAEATQRDVALYAAAVERFATRADRVLSRHLVRMGAPVPW